MILDKKYSLLNSLIAMRTILCWLLYTNFLMAQQFPKPLQLLQGKKELIYGLDNKITSLNHQNAIIYGVYAGVAFENYLRFKIGFNHNFTPKGLLMSPDNTIYKNSLFYINTGVEHDFMVIDQFRFTATTLVGAGNNAYEQFNLSKQLINKGNTWVFPVETGVYVTYYFMPAVGIKVGGGYRFVKSDLPANLNGYYLKCTLTTRLNEFIKTYLKK